MSEKQLSRLLEQEKALVQTFNEAIGDNKFKDFLTKVARKRRREGGREEEEEEGDEHEKNDKERWEWDDGGGWVVWGLRGLRILRGWMKREELGGS